MFIEMLFKNSVKSGILIKSFFFFVISTYAAYDFFQVFQSGPSSDNVHMKDFFFRREGERELLGFHKNFFSGF